MPFISTRTSCPISEAQELELKAALGDAITRLGKGESWLMLSFEGDCRLWFRGSNDKPLAMVEVSLLGKATRAQYEAMTACVTEKLCNILGLTADGVYVKYEETDHWGYAGSNF